MGQGMRRLIWLVFCQQRWWVEIVEFEGEDKIGREGFGK
jgi:hypothetical protein